MPENKKVSPIAIILGILIIAAGIYVMFFYLRAPRYTATVTKVSNVYTTRKRSGKRRSKRYNVRVSVEYVDKDGNQKTADNIHVKEARESALPQKGDTIQVVELFGVRRYSAATTVSIFIISLLLGLTVIVPKNKSRKNDNNDLSPGAS